MKYLIPILALCGACNVNVSAPVTVPEAPADPSTSASVAKSDSETELIPELPFKDAIGGQCHSPPVVGSLAWDGLRFTDASGATVDPQGVQSWHTGDRPRFGEDLGGWYRMAVEWTDGVPVKVTLVPFWSRGPGGWDPYDCTYIWSN